jgi:DNA-binding MarR family transcriptional regulator
MARKANLGRRGLSLAAEPGHDFTQAMFSWRGQERNEMRREKLKVVKPTEAPEQGRYVLDDQIGFLLRVAMQRHTSIFMSRMVENLTQTQFAALAKLYEVGPCSQNHLGRLIYLDAATIKGVVDRLSLRGFVTALADPKDRRRRAVTLSDRGREVTEAAIGVAGEITAATLTPLTAEEQQLIVRLLKRLG